MRNNHNSQITATISNCEPNLISASVSNTNLCQPASRPRRKEINASYLMVVITKLVCGVVATDGVTSYLVVQHFANYGTLLQDPKIHPQRQPSVWLLAERVL
jgi:hypothetical protein